MCEGAVVGLPCPSSCWVTERSILQGSPVRNRLLPSAVVPCFPMHRMYNILRLCPRWVINRPPAASGRHNTRLLE